MNAKIFSVLSLLAFIVVIASMSVEAHKKFYTQPVYQQQERCVCDCARPQPVLPSKPYYGSAGYAQPAPRPSGGYGNSGAYAVSGSYGAGGGQVSGGY